MMRKFLVIVTLFSVLFFHLFCEIEGAFSCTIFDPNKLDQRCANELCYYNINNCTKPGICQKNAMDEKLNSSKRIRIRYKYKYFSVNDWLPFKFHLRVEIF